MKATYNDLLQELWLRARNSGELVWETKNGDLLPIKNMSDSHLINAINLLNRKAEIENAQYEALGSIGDIDFI